MSYPDPAIIFVPGIRPKPPPGEQAMQLRRCLVAGLSRAGASDSEAAQLAGAFSLVGWSLQFYGEHADIGPDIHGIERLVLGDDSIDADRAEALSIDARITAGFYALGDRFPALTNLFSTRRMQTRVAEIHRYFHDPNGTARAARLMVADALQNAWDRGQRVMLIGHSFGSVIAYDTLWELSHMDCRPGRVDTLVTMGSPLTMGYIRRHLKGAAHAPASRYPTNIGRWVNLAAVGEVTALNRRLADCFAPMAERGCVGAIEDDLTLVNQFRGSDGLNVHKCYGYMASTTVADLLLAWQRASED
jgi:hypothetical protein